MPRTVSRKPLASVANTPVDVMTTGNPKSSVKSALKAAKTSRARAVRSKQTAPEPTVPASEPEVEPATVRSSVHFSELAPGVSRVEQENKELKAQLEDLTSQLARVSVSGATSSSSSTPAAPAANPFGGFLPVPKATVTVKPARPQNAFQCFSKDHRAEVKDSLPGESVHVVNQKLAEMWRLCKEKEPQTVAKYEDMVATDRERYDKEVAAFKEHQQQVETERAALEFKAEKLKMQKAMELYEQHLQSQKEKNAMTSGAAIKKPRAVRTAYNFYSMRRHQELTEADSLKTLPEKASQIGTEWNSLVKSRKKADKKIVEECHKLSMGDQDRFTAEMEAFNVRVAEAEQEQAKQSEEYRKQALAEYQEEMKQREAADAFIKMEAANKEVEKQERKVAREEKKAAKLAKANEPKRARTAYMFFFAEKAGEVSVQIKNQEVEGPLAAAVGALWKQCSEEEKQPFVAKAAADKERYQSEIAAHQQKWNFLCILQV